jgi:hypothetical protein
MLIEAVMYAIARARQAPLFHESDASADFDEMTIRSLKKKGYPFAPLFHVVDIAGLKPDRSDLFWDKINRKTEREIAKEEALIRKEAKDLLSLLAVHAEPN